jgi:hypothetical protein
MEQTQQSGLILGFWFHDAWKEFPRAADDPFQVPWFSDMWKTVNQEVKHV